MPATQGLNVTFSRCNDPSMEDGWNEWYDTVHLPDIMSAGLWWTVTRWQLAGRERGACPELGFSHMNLLEVLGPDVEGRMQSAAAANASRAREWREQGRLHPNQGVIDTIALKSVGRWSDKPAPSPRTKGMLMAFATCTDPTKVDDWNGWYDTVHIPDLLATGTFFAATRWVRLDPVPFRPNYLTIFETEDEDPVAAADLAASSAKTLRAAGRYHANHCGSTHFMLVPAGKWAGKGMHQVLAEADVDPDRSASR